MTGWKEGRVCSLMAAFAQFNSEDCDIVGQKRPFNLIIKGTNGKGGGTGGTGYISTTTVIK